MIDATRTRAAGLGAIGAASLLVACSTAPFTASADLSAPDAAPVDDASAPDDVGVAPPPPCDTTKSPAEDACVVTNALGLFVDGAHGDDANAGTRASPLKTLGAAVAKAGAKRIYACAGTYDESLTVTTSGVALYGGFACGTWAYGTTRAKVAPSAKGLALRVDGVTSARFEDVELVAQPGQAPGESSVTAYVSRSTGVVFRHVTLTAGAGVAGKAGATPTTALPVASDGVDGSKGGKAVTCDCAVGQSVGGKGGRTNANGGEGLPDLGGGLAGDSTKVCGAGGAGSKGADAAPAKRGEGANTYGMIGDTGWAASAGVGGTAGEPGQGGGGGGNSLSATAVGGGGACGGCGGGGATPGDGGGSSIALLAKNSSVRFFKSNLLTADAGNGGPGAPGQDGAVGSSKGGLGGVGGGCNGGPGGKGGDGGASGGGAGGLSAGVVYAGTEPTLDDATTTSFAHGTAGAGAKGGAPGTNDGKPGVAAVTVPLS